MKIASAASAFPKHYYSQKVLLERLQDYWGAQLKNPLLLARLHRNVTVDGRYLAIPAEEYVDIKTWGEANDIWIRVAQELGEQALCLALHNAGVKPEDLGALLFTTVTGVASPSIDALLINRMGLPDEHPPHADFWLGMRGGSCGNRARLRLRSRLSYAGSGSGVGRALLAHVAAGRSVGRKSDLVRAFRRWRGRRDRYRQGLRIVEGNGNGTAEFRDLRFSPRVPSFIPPPKK